MEFSIQFYNKDNEWFEINCDKLGAIDIYNQITNGQKNIIISNSIINKDFISQMILYSNNKLYAWRDLIDG